MTDASAAMADQEALLERIADDTLIVEIRSSSTLGASLLAFNAVAAQYGEASLTPQEWVEKEMQNALLARKRAWKYSADTRNTKAFADEMRAIAKLFNVPAPEHPKYQERMIARFEAEQTCRGKYGIQ
jgi:hypothetical protein